MQIILNYLFGGTFLEREGLARENVEPACDLSIAVRNDKSFVVVATDLMSEQLILRVMAEGSDWPPRAPLALYRAYPGHDIRTPAAGLRVLAYPRAKGCKRPHGTTVTQRAAMPQPRRA